MNHTVTLIAGDGIGNEVAEVVVAAIAALKVNINWDRQLAGLVAVEHGGVAVPEETLASLRRNHVGLKGPTTTPVGTGHQSANVQLRQKLGLFASVRPVRNLPAVPAMHQNVDLVIFRENTEGLYGGLEHTITPGVVVSLKVVTEAATRKIAHAAFDYARAQQRRKVTVVHKANILKLGDGTFLRVAQEVASHYPEIACNDMIVDATCMRLVQKPQDFDILLMENLYGDILSDLCSGLVGGLGIAPGANFGETCALFESVHGAAPDIAGKNLANPTALIQTAVLMLYHLGEQDSAERLHQGLCQVLARPEGLTRDLGGTATTTSFCKALLQCLGAS